MRLVKATQLLERLQEDESETAGTGSTRGAASNVGCTRATLGKCSGFLFCLLQSNALQLSYLEQVEVILVANGSVV